MKATVARAGALVLCAVALCAAAACGKRGNPLPPLQRIPVAPPDLAVTRVEGDVYVRFGVPTTNIDGASPADVGRVELYALTLDALPPTLSYVTEEDLRAAATLVAAEPVRAAVTPPVAVPEGMPAIPVPPPAPGVEPGATVVVREPITAATQALTALPQDDVPASLRLDEDPAMVVTGPLVAPLDGGGPQRYYFAVAVSPRGRYGPHTALVPAPLGPTSGAPSRPEIEVEETSMTLRWSPPEDARGVMPPPDPDLLPARSIVPTAPPTTYDVYEVARNQSPDAPLAMPAPLTPEPVGELVFTRSDITLGAERCFFVRSVDIVNGLHVRGPASPVACAAFADVFAPPPPRELVAVAVPGAINLIWEPSEGKDVAGYLVLRGESGSATLTPLMTTPMTNLSYRDESVRAGVRYVYAVVAVDGAGNRSDESNRLEETAQ